ncbi:hypothetical protein ZTR_09483 [Talaromyces verruculosus]|nr:hypothetical protein ZTR_09483 [Talaromyces verruculosus]
MDDSHSLTTTELQEFQEVPMAKICPGEIGWNTTISQLDEFQQIQPLKNGILFEKDFIMIKFSPMMPTLESAPPTPLPTMTTYHFRSNTTSDRALVESLDDELVTKLRGATWWSTEIRRHEFGGWKDDNR